MIDTQFSFTVDLLKNNWWFYKCKKKKEERDGLIRVSNQVFPLTIFSSEKR